MSPKKAYHIKKLTKPQTNRLKVNTPKQVIHDMYVKRLRTRKAMCIQHTYRATERMKIRKDIPH